MRYYVLYNPLAGNRTCTKSIESLDLPKTDTYFCDVTEICDYGEFLAQLNYEDVLVICGGDGTLNHFVNSTDGISIKNDILYFAAGSGNDFLHDLELPTDKLHKINSYLTNLPKVEIKGETYRFLNGIGFGLDGYCCEEGNRKRQDSNKPINYTPIAIKGLIYAFKPVNATVWVDGKEYTYSRVWMVPTMKGRFFGGGMKVAPDQNRTSKNSEVTVLVAHNLGKLNILRLFPSIFKGKHIKFKKYVEIHKGHSVKVRFDRPCAMQIDGETVSDVIEYLVTAESTVTV